MSGEDDAAHMKPHAALTLYCRAIWERPLTSCVSASWCVSLEAWAWGPSLLPCCVAIVCTARRWSGVARYGLKGDGNVSRSLYCSVDRCKAVLWLGTEQRCAMQRFADGWAERAWLHT